MVCTTFRGINVWRSEETYGYVYVRNPTVSLILNAWQPCPTEGRKDDTQQPSPPQYHFSLHVAWLMKRYSEAHIPETRKIRFSACHPPSSRPPSRLQLHRNVMMSTSKWTMDNNRRLERSLWCDHWATARLYYRVWMHSRLKSSTSAKKSNTECRSDAALEVDVAEDGNQAGIGHITTLDISLLGQ